jgi:hypothetical protein
LIKIFISDLQKKYFIGSKHEGTDRITAEFEESQLDINFIIYLVKLRQPSSPCFLAYCEILPKPKPNDCTVLSPTLPDSQADSTQLLCVDRFPDRFTM